MANQKLRRQIAFEAAQMIRAGQESEYYTAKIKAARRVARGWVAEEDLPSDEEIRALTQSLTSPAGGDRFDFYRRLVAALEQVKLNPQFHPEGDALNHTLQVFDLARQELPYDEEFLLAALLHDVGKAIDRRKTKTSTNWNCFPSVIVGAGKRTSPCLSWTRPLNICARWSKNTAIECFRPETWPQNR